jgi:hypothetical protein
MVPLVHVNTARYGHMWVSHRSAGDELNTYGHLRLRTTSALGPCLVAIAGIPTEGHFSGSLSTALSIVHTCNQTMLPSSTCTAHCSCTTHFIPNMRSEAIRSHLLEVDQCTAYNKIMINQTYDLYHTPVAGLVRYVHNSLNNKDFTEDHQGAVGFCSSSSSQACHGRIWPRWSAIYRD